MKFENNNSFAKIPNKMFASNTEWFVSNDAKLVYCMLQFLTPIGSLTEKVSKVLTSQDMLSYGLEWTTSKPTRDRKRVNEAIEELKDAGYIEAEELENKLLMIAIINIDNDSKVICKVPYSESERTFNGFTKITNDEFNKAKQNDDLTIYAYTKWRGNAKFDYKISFIEWSYTLNVSERSAREKIENTTSVLKISGKFNNSTGMRETNQYKIEKEQVEKNNISEQSIEDKLMNKISDDRVLGNYELLAEIQDQSVKMTERAFRIIKTTEDEVIEKLGKLKIDAMCKSAGGTKAIKKFNSDWDKELEWNELSERLIQKDLEKLNSGEDFEVDVEKQQEKLRNRKPSKVTNISRFLPKDDEEEKDPDIPW